MNDHEEIAAGYLLIRPVPWPRYASQSLLPGELVSASDSICPRFPDSSAIDWVNVPEESRCAALDAVGLAPERWGEARAWATAELEHAFGWHGVFYTSSGAIEARRRFFGVGTRLKVIGLGMPRRYVDELVAWAAPRPAMPGFAPEGESGYLQALKRHEPLAAGADRLGFELLAVQYGQVTSSWLQNGLETHCADVLGIRPGPNGLVQSLEAAERCRSEIARKEPGADPGLWLPWLLVEYTESGASRASSSCG